MARNGIDYLLALEMNDARRTALSIIFSEMSNQEVGSEIKFDWDKFDFVEKKG